MNIAEIRQKYPQYNDLSDMQLAQGLHKKYYSDMSFLEFAGKIGLISQSDAEKWDKRQKEYTQIQEENRPWVDKNPIGRLGVAVTQGVANSSLNPAGYIARAAGVDTRPFEPQNAAERIGELAGQYGFDAAVIATGLGGAAEAGMGGTGVTGGVIKTLAEGGIPLALTGSTGSAIATGTINPQNQYARMFTDLLGGGIGASMAARPKIQVANRGDEKAIKQIVSEIGQDALDENMREAGRTGRSLLEVGTDEIVQAAQKARQQTPEARKIFNERIAEINEAQPVRMRGAIDEALGTQGKNASIARVKDEAYRQAEPLFNEVRNMGDLETYEIAQKFKKLPMAEREILGIRTPEEYENILRQQADKAGVTLFDYGPDGIDHFLKDSQRTAVINTLDETLRNPDISGWRNSPKGIPTKYTMKKYIGDKGKDSSLYDVVMQQKENEIFNKFPRSSARDAAKNFKAPVSDLSAKDSLLNDMGTNPSSFGNNNISRLGTLVKENDVVADAIKKVKQSYSSLKKLPDTDANVLIEARKLLSEQTVSPNTTLAYQAKTALSEFDPVINNVTGGKLAQANKLYQDAHQYERAAELGRDVFNGRKGVEDFNTNFNGLSDMEKTAARIGLRDELLNKIGSATNESVATKKFLPQNVRDKMATIAGKKNADRIIDEAEQSVKSMRNINKFIGGSQTSEKQSLRDVAKGIRGFIRNPWDKTVDALFNPLDNTRNVRMAQYLTDPNIVNAYNNVSLQQKLNNARIPLRDIYLQNLMRTGLENQ